MTPLTPEEKTTLLKGAILSTSIALLVWVLAVITPLQVYNWRMVSVTFVFAGIVLFLLSL